MSRCLPPSASAIGYQTVWFDVSPWIATTAGPRPGHSCVASVMVSTVTRCTRRLLVGARSDLLVEAFQSLRGERRRLAVGDDLPLVRLDLRDRLGEAVGDLGRDRERAMVVGADQRRDGVTGEGSELGEERADLGGHEPLASRTDVERLDPVREARARDLLEGVDEVHQIESFRCRISRAFSWSAASCTEDRFGFTASARSKYSSARVGWSSWR